MGHEEVNAPQNMHEDDFPMQDNVDSVNVNSNGMHMESNNSHTHEEDSVEINVENPPLTRERRNRSRPAYLDDYIVNLPSSIDQATPVTNRDSSTVHSLANFISYKNCTHSHRAFLAGISTNNEPKSFNQAVQNVN